jgi:hypothetical protein
LTNNNKKIKMKKGISIAILALLSAITTQDAVKAISI